MLREDYMYRLLLSTASSREEAQSIASALVERRLAACVNTVGPIESCYRWKGAVETAQEFLLLIKTTTERIPELKKAIVGLHSYDVPELIEFQIEGGLQAYLDWISESVGDSAGLDPRTVKRT